MPSYNQITRIARHIATVAVLLHCKCSSGCGKHTDLTSFIAPRSISLLSRQCAWVSSAGRGGFQPRGRGRGAYQGRGSFNDYGYGAYDEGYGEGYGYGDEGYGAEAYGGHGAGGGFDDGYNAGGFGAVGAGAMPSMVPMMLPNGQVLPQLLGDKDCLVKSVSHPEPITVCFAWPPSEFFVPGQL